MAAATPMTTGQLLRGAFLLLLIAVMTGLLVLTLRSLLLAGGDDDEPGTGTVAASTGATTDEEVAAETVDAEAGTVEIAAESTAGWVTCGRPIDDDAGPYRIHIDDLSEREEIIVAVDLIGADGERDGRRLTIQPTLELPIQVVVPDSTDPDRHRSCVVTGVQQGERVILTGR